MYRTNAAIALLSAASLLGCKAAFHSGESGPKGTLAYFIKVESSVPGAAVETNGVFAGKTPLTLKLFGDYPGYFRDFGSPEFVLRVLPENSNHFIQTRIFRTGHGSAPGDRIPGFVFVDLSQPNGGVILDLAPDR
jgi:hypothetical protein